jgi:hypothetical protein
MVCLAADEMSLLEIIDADDDDDDAGGDIADDGGVGDGNDLVVAGVVRGLDEFVISLIDGSRVIVVVVISIEIASVRDGSNDFVVVDDVDEIAENVSFGAVPLTLVVEFTVDGSELDGDVVVEILDELYLEADVLFWPATTLS